MSAPAIDWLETRYEVTAAALEAVRLGRPLTSAQRHALTEARLPVMQPPRPGRFTNDAGWRWQPGEPRPEDGRNHP